MCRILEEDVINFNEAAASLPGRPAKSTVHRWRTRGVRGIKLEGAKIGGTWFTSRQSLRRFIAAVTLAADPTQERTSSFLETSGADVTNAASVDHNKIDLELKKLGL